MTSLRSILDKPLKDLTEDDISQLTREDCRNFLKLKGMRRPSWNKSQAIQQVICLKALLESTEDSGASVLRKLAGNPQKGANPVANTAGRADECSPYRRKDHPQSILPRNLGSRAIDADIKAVSHSPRSLHETNEPVGQMTIFYCGKVNVYDGILPDKAHTVMQLAGSPVNLSHDDSFSGTMALLSFPCHLQTAGDQNGTIPASAIVSPSMQVDVEGAASRKVSLQRYLEKRKDRGRFKLRKEAGLTSPSMEIYSNHQAWINASDAQLSRTSTTSATQHAMPDMSSNSADRQGKIAGLSVDLNDKGYLTIFICIYGVSYVQTVVDPTVQLRGY